MNLRRVVLMSLVVCVVAAPVSAQEPGVDEDDCKGKDSKLLSRMPGCGLYECSAKDYDAADVVVSANPEWKLRVERHTDNVGNPSANLKLSQARAAAVVSWLVSNGVDAGRLRATGLGDTQPVDSNASDAGKAKNRRVVLAKQQLSPDLRFLRLIV